MESLLGFFWADFRISATISDFFYENLCHIGVISSLNYKKPPKAVFVGFQT